MCVCASICVHSTDGHNSIDERHERRLSVQVGAPASLHLETRTGEECSALAHITRPQRVAVVTAILANSGFIAVIAIFTRLMWSVSLEVCVFWIALRYGSAVISEKQTNKKIVLVWSASQEFAYYACGFVWLSFGFLVSFYHQQNMLGSSGQVRFHPGKH